MSLLPMIPMSLAHEAHRLTPFRVSLSLCAEGSRLPVKGKGEQGERGNMMPLYKLSSHGLCNSLIGRKIWGTKTSLWLKYKAGVNSSTATRLSLTQATCTT